VLDASQDTACQLGTLAEVLRLPVHGLEQDWGIELADPERVDEFIAFFEEHRSVDWTRWTVEEYVDLVLQSAHEALEAKPTARIPGLRNFVARVIRLSPERAQYWADWRDEEGEWPISDLIRELAG
jgi:hypothetical protein